ncbi:MAG: hypothetical protein SF123_22885 [Chloroflexota bacterium]|nr:hypothetical protein [Chloroflexota bacterium]
MKQLLNPLVWVLIILAFHVQPVVHAQEVPDITLASVWSLDGSHLARTSRTGSLQVWNMASGVLELDVNPYEMVLYDIAWSPDGARIAVGANNGDILIWDVQSGTQITTLQSQLDAAITLDWSSDGNYLASGSILDTRQLRLWDMRTYENVAIVGTGDTFSVAFSPTGDRVATAGISGIRIVPVTARGVIEADVYRPISHPGFSAVAWNTDGSQLAGTGVDGKLYIYDMTQAIPVMFATYDILQRPQGEMGFEWAMTIDWNAYTNSISMYDIEHGEVIVWDITVGQEIARYANALTMRTVVGHGFSPYGGQLAYANNAPLSSGASTVASTNVVGAGSVSLVVPAPSPERLQAITDACGLAPAADQALTAEISTQDYAGFTTQLEALPETALPPGCRADLLAVAAALAAEGQ